MKELWNASSKISQKRQTASSGTWQTTESKNASGGEKSSC